MAVLPNHVPDIKQLYLISTASLPVDQQAWVKLDMSPATTGDLLLYEDTDNADERFLKWLVSRIKEWNFTEADGTPISINYETVQRLPKEDYVYLFRKHIEAMAKQKSFDLGDTEKKT